MPRLRRSLLTSVTALLVLAPSAFADCPSADVVPTGANAAEVRTAVVCLTNVERAAEGLGALRSEGTLEAPAQAFAGRLAAEHFFSHVAPDGSRLASRLTAYTDWTTIGENIAWGEGSLSTPRATVAAWMASPGHRANILNGAYEEVGIGVVDATPTGTRAGATYVADYGAREEAAAPAPAPAAAKAPAARKPAVRRTTCATAARARRATAAKSRRIVRCTRAAARRA